MFLALKTGGKVIARVERPYRCKISPDLTVIRPFLEGTEVELSGHDHQWSLVQDIPYSRPPELLTNYAPPTKLTGSATTATCLPESC